jgi:probable DNA metabolism protein
MGGVYRYDGTVAGLLTVLAECVPKRIIPEAITIESAPQQSLFAEVIAIETDQDRAEVFWDQLTGRLTPESCAHICYVLLADHPEREMMISRYLLLAWEVGKKIGSMLAHPHVAPFWKLARQVGGEAHRYKGFVRFQEVTGGFYYAAISPDHRVLSLIAPHFADRFNDQQWVIHDVKHGEGIVYDRQRREWLLLPMEATADPELTPAEEQFKALWRSYFKTLAIAERDNPGLQKSKVPLKVRPWLVEFGEGS